MTEKKNSIEDIETMLDNLDPNDTPAVDAADLRAVGELASARDEIETKLRDAVIAAHNNGKTWGEIGLALGVSRQAARQRYGASASHSGLWLDKDAWGSLARSATGIRESVHGMLMTFGPPGVVEIEELAPREE